MKSILLSSAAIFAFAGVAAADGHASIGITGEATLGYNDDTTTGNEDFYYDASLTFAGSTTLDNGLTAGLKITATLDTYCGGDSGEAEPLSGYSYVCWEGYELSLVGDNAGLYFGDTATAAEPIWDGVSGSEVGGFDESGDNGEEAILRGEVTFGAVSAYISYQMDGLESDDTGGLEGLQFAATASFGTVDAILAYQDADNSANDGETLGLQVGTTFGAAAVKLAYLDADNGDSSIGVEVGYPIGPVEATVYYTANTVNDDSYGLSVAYATGPVSVNVFFDNDQGTDDWGIEGSYDVGNGLMVMAGVVDSGEDFYIAGAYDLGGGASVLVSYADDGDADAGDEIGDPEYQNGTTVELTFAF